MKIHGIGTLNELIKTHSPENKEVVYTEGQINELQNEIILECVEMDLVIESSLAAATRVIFGLSLEGTDLASAEANDKFENIMEAAEGTKENPLKRFWKFVSGIFAKVWDYVKRHYTRFALNAKKLNTTLTECKTKLNAAKSKGDLSNKSVELTTISFERMATCIELMTNRLQITVDGGTKNNVVFVNDNLNKTLESAKNSGDYSKVKERLKDKDVANIMTLGSRAGVVRALLQDLVSEITWPNFKDTAPTTKQFIDGFTSRDRQTFTGSGLLTLVNSMLSSTKVINVMGVVNSIKSKGNSLEKEHARFKKLHTGASKDIKSDDKELKEMAVKLSKYYSITMSAYTTATDYALALLLEYVRQMKSATDKIV